MACISLDCKTVQLTINNSEDLALAGMYKIYQTSIQRAKRPIIIIQRTIQLDSDSKEQEWYEMCSLAAETPNNELFKKSVFKSCPTYMLDSRYQAWLHTESIKGNSNSKLVIIDTVTQKIKYSSNQQQTLYVHDSNGNKTDYIVLDIQENIKKNSFISNLIKIFARFEDKNFIQLTMNVGDNKENPKFKVLLPRYNLEFNLVHMQQSTFKIVSAKDAKIRVVTSGHKSIFPNFNKGLLLEHEQSNKEKKYQVIVPQKQFYLDPDSAKNKDKIYHNFLFDLGMRVKKDFLIDLSVIDALDQRVQMQYINSERYSTFNVGSDKNFSREIIAATSEDQLMQAYILLNRSQPEAAFKMFT